MNQQLKTILLTVLTLSLFVIALVELSGISRTAFFNRYGGAEAHHHDEIKIPDIQKTTIAFDDKKHDFGTIKEGDQVTHTYHFTNTGEHPLVIVKAEASCGCTVPSYSKEPVLPGQRGSLTVSFNSTNRPGHQQKNVLVYSNAQAEAMALSFEAEVISKDKISSRP